MLDLVFRNKRLNQKKFTPKLYNISKRRAFRTSIFSSLCHVSIQIMVCIFDKFEYHNIKFGEQIVEIVLNPTSLIWPIEI